MSNLVPPHGGKLNPLLALGDEKVESLKEASHLPMVKLNSKEVSDLIMLAKGDRPSEQFSRKEVLDILVKYYQSGGC